MDEEVIPVRTQLKFEQNENGMCGRFALMESVEIVSEAFDVSDASAALKPRFNIAPTQNIVAVRQDPKTKKRELAYLRWGLIPSWVKDPGAISPLINARLETITTKPSFSAALKRRRCLIPASGFYEWKKIPREKYKQPFFITPTQDRMFAFAGIWEYWEDRDRGTMESCAIITTAPNAKMSQVHDRMPALIDKSHFETWLNPEIQMEEAILDLLKVASSEQFSFYEVSTYVNNISNEDPECLSPKI